MYTHTLFVVLEALSRVSLKLGMCFTQPFIYFSKTIIDLQKLKDPMLPLGLVVAADISFTAECSVVLSSSWSFL